MGCNNVSLPLCQCCCRTQPQYITECCFLCVAVFDLDYADTYQWQNNSEVLTLPCTVQRYLFKTTTLSSTVQHLGHSPVQPCLFQVSLQFTLGLQRDIKVIIGLAYRCLPPIIFCQLNMQCTALLKTLSSIPCLTEFQSSHLLNNLQYQSMYSCIVLSFLHIVHGILV